MSQWIHQNNILLSVTLFFLVTFVWMTLFKRWNRLQLLTWLGLLGVSAVALFALRTSPASVTGVIGPAQEDADQPAETVNLEFHTVDEITAYLSNSDRPTLVEFYSDFGFS